MKEVLLNDENFSKLAKYLDDNSGILHEDVIKAIQSFRNSLSYNYITNLCKNDDLVELLKDIWDTLFLLAADKDPTIRISIFNTFGTVLFSLTPFYPLKVINAFILSVQNIKPEKGVSISVIACYCQITRFVSLLYMSDFYSNIPILEHFGEEFIEDDLKYLPTLFSMLEEPINNEFNFVMFRTLIKNFRNKTIKKDLIKSLYELIKKSPLILELDDQILDDKLNTKIALNLYPLILQNKDLVQNHLKPENLKKVEDLAMSFLMKPNETSFSDFEQCATIIVYLQLYNSQKQNLQELNVFYSKNKLPSDYEVFTMKMFFDIDKNIPNRMKDNLTVITSKIDALAFHMKTMENEEIYLKCLESFYEFSKVNGEAFSHVTESMTFLFKNQVQSFAFTNDKIKRTYNDIFYEIFNKAKINWVQQLSICTFLCSVPEKEGELLYPNFGRERIKFILPFTLSNQKDLAKESKKQICRIISVKECQYVIDFILRSDLIDPSVFCNCCELVNMISKTFSFSLFEPLKDLLCESYLLSSSITASYHFFYFLNHIQEKESQKEECERTVFERSLDLLIKLHKSYTGVQINIASSIDSFDIPNLNSLIETDILSVNLKNNFYINCMEQCYIYCSNYKNIWTTANLMPISSVLITIFPRHVFKYLRTKVIPQQAEISKEFVAKICELLVSTNSIRVAAETSELCASIGLDKDANIRDLVYRYLDLQIKNGYDLYYFYKFCGNDVIRTLSSLNKENLCLFNFLTESALTGVKIENGNLTLLKSTMFCDWPLHNKEVQEYAVSNISELIPTLKQQYLQDQKTLKHHQSLIRAIHAREIAEQQGAENPINLPVPKEHKTRRRSTPPKQEIDTENREHKSRRKSTSTQLETPPKVRKTRRRSVQTEETSHEIIKDPTYNFDFKTMDVYHRKFLGMCSKSFTFFSQRDFDMIERFSSEKPNLKIVKEDTSLSISETPALISNEIIDDNHLLMNFCQFSTLQIDTAPFNLLCEVLVEKKMDKALFLLAKNQNRAICENLLEQVTKGVSITDRRDIDIIVLMAEYYSATKQKSASIKELFHKISTKIKNPILQMRKNRTAFALVALATRPSFETFIQNFVPTKKYFKSLIYFINCFGHITDKEIELINYCLSVHYDDQINFVWLLRYIRMFASFHLSLSEIKQFEEKMMDIKGICPLLEIKGIVGYVECPLFIKNVPNERYMNVLFVEGRSLAKTVKSDELNWCIQSQVPSFLCSAMRCVKTLLLPENYNAFYYSYWNIILQVKETRNIIVLEEFSKILYFIESEDNKPKQYAQYIKPAAHEMYKKIETTGEKELFEDLFKDENQNAQNSEQKKSVMSFVNRYFLGEAPISITYDIADETMSEMGTMGAAYFIIGQTDISKAHFFELYAVLVKIVRRMKKSEFTTFSNIVITQIIPKLKNRQKAAAYSELFKWERKAILEGARMAALYDANSKM